MVWFAKELLSRFIAPGIGDFDSAEIPEMADYHPESSHWLSNHFLNSVLRANLNFHELWDKLPRHAASVWESALDPRCADG